VSPAKKNRRVFPMIAHEDQSLSFWSSAVRPEEC
jgi:hypothetical protein